MGTDTGVRERALQLLGDGNIQETVAAALGVSVSYISQLLSEEEFASAVAEKKYNTLASRTQRDSRYDALEDTILERLQKSVGMEYNPVKLAGILSKVNGATRRGAQAPLQAQNSSPIIQLTLSKRVVNNFIVNTANQVVEVEGTSLVTLPKNALEALSNTHNAEISANKLLADMNTQKVPMDFRTGKEHINDAPYKNRA